VHTIEEVAQPGNATDVHLPSPSYWPIVAAFALPIIAYGLIYTLWLCLVGGLVLTVAVFGWALEPPDAPGGGHGDEHGPDDAHGDATELESGSTDAAAESDAVDEAKEVETVG
jgi:cytochrome c oxidase subunit I